MRGGFGAPTARSVFLHCLSSPGSLLVVHCPRPQVFYYDSFHDHDAQIVQLFDPFLRTSLPKKIIGNHISLPLPDAMKALQSSKFESLEDALMQEWVRGRKRERETEREREREEVCTSARLCMCVCSFV